MTPTPLIRFALAMTAGAMALVTVGVAGAQNQVPGTRIHVTPADMPPPFVTDSVSNGPDIIDRPADATLAVPPGFTASLFAEGLERPREFAIAPNGDVLVSLPRADRIMLLRDADGDGRAETVGTFIDDFDRPYGLTILDGHLYVADTDGLWRIPYAAGDETAADRPERLTARSALGSGRGHWTRSLAISPDGTRAYIGVGSRDNIDDEDPPRATVQEFVLDGGQRAAQQSTLASGLRNPVGMAFAPGTSDLYTVVNERDGLGDGLVPDYLTRVERGAFYGWPYAYIGPNPQPDYAERRPDLVAQTVVPDVLFEAHSAPIGLVFYDGDLFPPDYRGDAFVALRGSWNRSDPTGYKVVRVPFTNGRPEGWYETFASGFWTDGTDQARVWGRPTGLAVMPDGALLIADEIGGTIWRVTYGP